MAYLIIFTYFYKNLLNRSKRKTVFGSIMKRIQESPLRGFYNESPPRPSSPVLPPSMKGMKNNNNYRMRSNTISEGYLFIYRYRYI